LTVAGSKKERMFKMTDRELLEVILEKIGGMDARLTGVETNMATKAELAEVKTELSSVKTDIAEVKTELSSVKAIVIKIEHDHGQKLGALFDGHAQNSEKLDRIEAEITRHEEIIMRRVR
jgi:septal ring factor EnvC (AmiA/AmiB activator)